eukprot:2511693-Rhodomonas_salina.3
MHVTAKVTLSSNDNGNGQQVTSPCAYVPAMQCPRENGLHMHAVQRELPTVHRDRDNGGMRGRGGGGGGGGERKGGRPSEHGEGGEGERKRGRVVQRTMHETFTGHIVRCRAKRERCQTHCEMPCKI